jgi:uncharacterized protein DUF1843
MATKKTSKAKAKPSAARSSGPLPPYGDPIRAAIASGDVAKMKKTASDARAWLKKVQAALADLDQAINQK